MEIDESSSVSLLMTKLLVADRNTLRLVCKSIFSTTHWTTVDGRGIYLPAEIWAHIVRYMCPSQKFDGDVGMVGTMAISSYLDHYLFDKYQQSRSPMAVCSPKFSGFMPYNNISMMFNIVPVSVTRRGPGSAEIQILRLGEFMCGIIKPPEVALKIKSIENNNTNLIDVTDLLEETALDVYEQSPLPENEEETTFLYKTAGILSEQDVTKCLFDPRKKRSITVLTIRRIMPINIPMLCFSDTIVYLEATDGADQIHSVELLYGIGSDHYRKYIASPNALRYKDFVYCSGMLLTKTYHDTHKSPSFPSLSYDSWDPSPRLPKT